MRQQKILEDLRELRSRWLGGTARGLSKVGFTANRMTFLSLVFGLLAAYFLFRTYYLFIFFAVLHLFADSLDGVLARLDRPTRLGKYFDYLADQTITILLMVRMYFYLHDYYIILIIVMFILTQAVYLISEFRAPAYFLRTGGLVLLSLSPLFHPAYLTAVYLLGGIVTIYSLLCQLNHFLRTKSSSL